MKQLLRAALIALIIFAQQSIMGQPGSPLMPSVNAVAKNFVQTAGDSFEFDVFLSSTGTNPFHYATAQYAFNINPAVIPSGATLTMTLVAGSSQIPSAIRPNNFLTYPTTGILYITARIPVVGMLTVAQAPAETKVGRFKVLCSAPFEIAPLNLTWRNASAFPETIMLYSDDPEGTALTYEITDDHIAYIADGGNIPLPVELSSLTAISEGRNVNVSWQTKSESQSSMFEVERTLQSEQSWVKVGEVTASGNSNSVKEYSFTDKKLNSGKYSYRLKMVDANGTFKYSDAVEAEISLPKDYAISQNFPNPFNPTTRIDYQLPFDSKVTLELYGITGEKVATLINSELSAGYYTADINASAMNLASGVYIYRMNAQNPTGQNFVQVKKLMLTK